MQARMQRGAFDCCDMRADGICPQVHRTRQVQGSHQTVCDVNECNLNVAFVMSSGGHDVVVTGGTPVYTYNIGSVNTTGNSPTYSNCGQLVIPSAVQSATITVTDATGCIVTATYVSN